MATGQWRRPKKGLIALVALGILTEAERHPYEIQRVIAQRHKDFLDDKPRALYHAIERLAEAGLIEEVGTSREGRRPERTAYRATSEGVEELKSWIWYLLAHPELELESFEVAVGMVAYLPTNLLLEALSQRSALLHGILASYEASAQVLRDKVGLPRLFLLEHEFAAALRQAELAWVHQLSQDLEEGRLRLDPDWLRRLAQDYPPITNLPSMVEEAFAEEAGANPPPLSPPQAEVQEM